MEFIVLVELKGELAVKVSASSEEAALDKAWDMYKHGGPRHIPGFSVIGVESQIKGD